MTRDEAYARYKAENAALRAIAHDDTLPMEERARRIKASFYDDYGCYIGTPGERYAVALWGLCEAVAEVSAAYQETIGDAGRNWAHCEFTRARLDKINAEIKEAFAAASDRLDDLASD